MNIKELLGKQRLYFDGGMGTLLQARGLKAGERPEEWNITHPEIITEIHLEYLKAGSNIISTNTFGANPLKTDNFRELIVAAIKNAKKAVELFDADKEKCFIAFDMGPTGRMLEPLGDLKFEAAVEAFGEIAAEAQKNGADLIIIETMNDSYETKAAVLGSKENSSLPVFVSNVFDERGKLMTGADARAMIAMLEGLGVDAVGMNCSLGPKQMLPVVRDYVEFSSLPVTVSPNAGLPRSENGKTVFDVDAEEFSDIMREFAQMGVGILGGCCGTTPEYIKRTAEKTKDIPFVKPEKKSFTLVSSYTHAVEIGNEPILIGERINPTGKPKFKDALRRGDIDYIVAEGVKQQEKGVHILDVNVGLPEIDEDKMLSDSVKALQAVLDLPLQLDSVRASSLERAMRLYNGKPLINSVNGKKESMAEILPLVRKYGGVLIALTIDENGIPDTAEGRLSIARKIVLECERQGIDRRDIIVDPLAMAVSSDKNSGRVTLESVELIKKELGVKTSLGVSNISFGLPQREVANSFFFALALERGLDLAIMNPNSVPMLQAYHSFRALRGLDEACAGYIAFAAENEVTAVKKEASDEKGSTDDLVYAIVRGMREPAFEKARKLLETTDPMTVVNEKIIPALDEVGKGFENKTVYLPGLLMSAEAASRAFEAVKEKMGDRKGESKGRIVLATVKGDIHDIGKNIVKVLFENYGFDVIDLGKDVAPERILEAVKESGAGLVGLSALMTTTVEAMKDTVELLKKGAPGVKTIVGGAVLTPEYAEMIGATYYAKDAMDAVRLASR